jgi:hypothetical protein
MERSLVESLFFPNDAEEILKTKIVSHTMEDTVAWHYEKTGVFSVKSAYRL